MSAKDKFRLLRRLCWELSKLLGSGEGEARTAEGGVHLANPPDPVPDASQSRTPGNRFSENCSKDILQVLKDAGGRLSTTQILDALARRGIIWSASVVGHTLAELRRRKQVTNGHDTLGRGYGLVEWDRDKPAA